MKFEMNITNYKWNDVPNAWTNKILVLQDHGHSWVKMIPHLLLIYDIFLIGLLGENTRLCFKAIKTLNSDIL